MVYVVKNNLGLMVDVCPIGKDQQRMTMNWLRLLRKILDQQHLKMAQGAAVQVVVERK